MFGAGLQTTQRPEMLAGLVAQLGKCVGAERSNPFGQASSEWRQVGFQHFEFRQQALGAFVTRVGAHRGIHIGTKNAVGFGNRIKSGDYGVGGRCIVGCWLARCDATHIVGVKEQAKAAHIGAKTLHGIGKRASVERLVNISNTPTGQGRCFRHAEKLPRQKHRHHRQSTCRVIHTT